MVTNQEEVMMMGSIEKMWRRMVVILLVACGVAINVHAEPIAQRAVVAQRLSTPSIDGDSSMWQQAVTYRLTPVASTAQYPTDVRIGYDENGLYVDVNCFDDKIDGLRREVKNRDGKIWEDDSVELFLCPATNFNYVQLSTNANGIQGDGRGDGSGVGSFDANFNLNWTVRTRVTNYSWSALFFVPWSSLKVLGGDHAVAQEGAKWRVKLFRTRPAKNHEPRELSTLFPFTRAGLSFHDSGEYGALFLGRIPADVGAQVKKQSAAKLKHLDSLVATMPAKIRFPLQKEIAQSQASLLDNGTNTLSEVAADEIVATLERRVANSMIAIRQSPQIDALPPWVYVMTHAYERIYPDQAAFTGYPALKPVCMMAGERRSFQLVVSPTSSIPKGVTISAEPGPLAPYVELGEVACVDISRFSLGLTSGHRWYPDPIVNYAQKTTLLSSPSVDCRPIVFWVTVDLPEGEAPGKKLLKLGLDDGNWHQECVVPVEVLPLSITLQPNLVLPYADIATALGAYTGYLREKNQGNRSAFTIADEVKYQQAVQVMCEDLVRHRVSACMMESFLIPPWFSFTIKNGVETCDTTFWEKTAQTAFAAGIQQIFVAGQWPSNEKQFQLACTSWAEVLRRNGWLDKVWFKMRDEPDVAVLPELIRYAKIARSCGLKVFSAINRVETVAELAPYSDAWHPSGGKEIVTAMRHERPGLPIWPYMNNTVLGSPLHDPRYAAWKLEGLGVDMYSYYAHNLWVYWTNDPWNDMQSYVGLAESFRVYPPRDFPAYPNGFTGNRNTPFTIASSMRWEATADAVQDMLLIRKFRMHINKLKQNGKAGMALDAEKLLAKWQASLGEARIDDQYTLKFDHARTELIEFIIHGHTKEDGTIE